MAVNPNIPLSVRPWQSASPMEMAGNAMQLQGMQQQIASNRMAFEQQKQAMQQQFELRKAMQQAGGDPQKAVGILRGLGMFDQAAEIEKGQVGIDKTRAETAKTRFDAGKSRMDLQRNLFATAHSDPSDEGLLRAARGMVQMGVMDEAGAQSWLQEMTGITDPNQRKQRLFAYARTPEQLIEQHRPNLQRRSTGQHEWFEDVNPNSNPQGGAPVQLQMSPAQIQAANDAVAGRSVTVRGQDLTDARARDRLELDRTSPRGVPMVDANGNVILVDPRSATSRPVTGQDGGPVEQGKVAEERNARIRQASEALNVIADVRQILPKATGSRAGATWDQVLATFGASTEGGEAIAQLRVLGNRLLMQVPRFGGPQSDKDVQAYRDAAGNLADPHVPFPIKMAALDTIEMLNRRQLGQSDVSGTPGPVGQRGAAETNPPANVPRPAPTAGPRTQQMDSWPMPRDTPVGAIITDNRTGERLRNNGKSWEPVR